MSIAFYIPIRAYTLDELQSLVREAGYDVEKAIHCTLSGHVPLSLGCCRVACMLDLS